MPGSSPAPRRQRSLLARATNTAPAATVRMRFAPATLSERSSAASPDRSPAIRASSESDPAKAFAHRVFLASLRQGRSMRLRSLSAIPSIGVQKRLQTHPAARSACSYAGSAPEPAFPLPAPIARRSPLAAQKLWRRNRNVGTNRGSRPPREVQQKKSQKQRAAPLATDRALDSWRLQRPLGLRMLCPSDGRSVSHEARDRGLCVLRHFVGNRVCGAVNSCVAAFAARDRFACASRSFHSAG